MALTTSQRQARYRKQLKAKAREGVTPDEVRRAIRLMYEHQASFPENRLPPWEEWLAACQKRGTRSGWFDMAPDSGAVDDYADEFSEPDAKLLAKVGAVILAAKQPPSDPV